MAYTVDMSGNERCHGWTVHILVLDLSHIQEAAELELADGIASLSNCRSM